MSQDDDMERKLNGDAEGSILGQIKQKLVRTKAKWAAEGRGMSTGATSAAQPAEVSVGGRTRPRLPPGQRLTQDFPVLDLGVRPAIRPQDWRLTVSGRVDNPIDWDWDTFHAQPQVSLITDIHCVTTWSRYDNAWQGVSAKHFLSIVKPKPDAAFMVFHCHDGYSTNLPLKAFDDDDVMLVHSWNGKPLAREHGGPIRPIIPKLYLWKSAKWVKHITFLDKDAPGFWEVRGYHNTGDPWEEQRYG